MSWNTRSCCMSGNNFDYVYVGILGRAQVSEDKPQFFLQYNVLDKTLTVLRFWHISMA